jgi:hypothetical protein
MKHNHTAFRSLLHEKGWGLPEVARILQEHGRKASYASVKIWASEKSPKFISDENLNLLKSIK